MLSQKEMPSCPRQISLFATFIFLSSHYLGAQYQYKLPPSSFGFQLSPFLIGSPNLGRSIILADSLLVGLEDLANANPSLQAGFFFEGQISERWRLRVDANLMHRSVWHVIVDNPWRGFFQTKITPAASILITVSLPLQIQYQLHKKLHVGAGLATQIHFGPRESSYNNWSRPDIMLANRVEQAHRNVTLHAQYGIFWHSYRWTFGLSMQESLMSITTGFEWRGINYELPELNTKIYYLNIGYRLVPAKRKWQKSQSYAQ
jgi:hypothetical protein